MQPLCQPPDPLQMAVTVTLLALTPLIECCAAVTINFYQVKSLLRYSEPSRTEHLKIISQCLFIKALKTICIVKIKGEKTPVLK
jgi:hypothetical protein